MAETLDMVNEVLNYEAGRFQKEIYERTVVSSPILTMVKEGDWPAGMGSSINVMTWSRMLPADATTRDAKKPTWSAVSFSADDPDGPFGGSAGTATGGSCIPPLTTVPAGFGTKTYNLEQTAIESPNLCVNDLRNSFETEQTLKAMVNALKDVTKWVLVNKIRDLFRSICTVQVLVSAQNGAAQSTTMPSGSGLTPRAPTWETFTDLYVQLVQAGASDQGIPKLDGAPIFPLMVGMELSKALKQQTGYRDDIRWNKDAVPELIAALGSMSAPINGFQMVNEILPDRWNYDGGWVWVPPYTYELDAGSNKYVMVANPDYQTAAWEDTFIFHPDVFHLVFPGSISAAGGGTSFTPVKYRGEWSWKNIIERGRNPDGTIGYFRGLFMLGGLPIYSEFGAVVRHARCRPAPQYAACAS